MRFSPVGHSDWSEYREARLVQAQAAVNAKLARLEEGDVALKKQLEAERADIGEAVNSEPCRVSFAATVNYNFLDDQTE